MNSVLEAIKALRSDFSVDSTDLAFELERISLILTLEPSQEQLAYARRRGIDNAWIFDVLARYTMDRINHGSEVYQAFLIRWMLEQRGDIKGQTAIKVPNAISSFGVAVEFAQELSRSSTPFEREFGSQCERVLAALELSGRTSFDAPNTQHISGFWKHFHRVHAKLLIGSGAASNRDVLEMFKLQRSIRLSLLNGLAK